MRYVGQQQCGCALQAWHGNAPPQVAVVLPMTGMAEAGKLQAEKAIDVMQARGHTNLSGGLLLALQTLYRIPAADATAVESVLVFTDGKANYGITKQDALEKATR